VLRSAQRILLSLSVACVLAACATVTPTRAPQPSRPVDAAQFYTGAWREIGRRPMSITDGCVAGATAYTRIDVNHVRVRDTCQQGAPTGPEKAIGGPATILDPGINTKLRVSYRIFGFIPVQRDYWMLDHDDAYTWFIMCDPAFENLWIYTRQNHPSPGLRQALITKAQALGYDTSRLEFPAQP
jgi:apolipoprotein D and lipocalin family protein